MLSHAKKKYLFFLYELGSNGNEVRSRDLAACLQVKRPSVSKMLTALREEGLIEKEYYSTIRFTQAGARISNALYTDYLLLNAFFQEKLGVSKENARQDAITGVCSFTDEGLQKLTAHMLGKK